MMKELALHVLDIAENSVRGEAKTIEIIIEEDLEENRFVLDINDDGKGIPEDMLKTIRNPFTTTRTHRKVGMGIPFLNDTCLMCGGKLTINSTVGVGTKVHAEMEHKNIDRPPLGDIASTLVNLFSSYPDIHFQYQHSYRDAGWGEPQKFAISTDELYEILDGTPLSTPSVYLWVRDFLRDSIAALKDPDAESDEES